MNYEFDKQTNSKWPPNSDLHVSQLGTKTFLFANMLNKIKKSMSVSLIIKCPRDYLCHLTKYRRTDDACITGGGGGGGVPSVQYSTILLRNSATLCGELARSLCMILRGNPSHLTVTRNASEKIIRRQFCAQSVLALCWPNASF